MARPAPERKGEGWAGTDPEVAVSCRTGLTAVLIASACLTPAGTAAAAPQPILPFPLPPGLSLPEGWRLPDGWRLPLEPDLSQVPARTTLSVRPVLPGANLVPSGMKWGTANETEERAALSISKLYLADYALRHGSASAEDRDLAERMIRSSDDAAADRIAFEYPTAIDATAVEYTLTATHGNGDWRFATTSTADVADFLAAKVRTDPESPILDWMRHPPSGPPTAPAKTGEPPASHGSWAPNGAGPTWATRKSPRPPTAPASPSPPTPSAPPSSRTKTSTPPSRPSPNSSRNWCRAIERPRGCEPSH